MIFLNKKAQGTTTFRKLVLTLIIMLLLGYLLTLGWKEFRKSMSDCPQAYCKVSCDYSKEIREGTMICKDANVCCKPLDPNTNPLSVECKDKKPGDYCAGTYPSGTYIPKVCNANLECIELCTYCASNPTYLKCIFTVDKVLGKKITSFTNSFSCKCTDAKCAEINRDSGTTYSCIKGFCSSTTASASDYMCCNVGG